MKKILLLALSIFLYQSTALAADIKIAYESDATSMDPMEQLSQANLAMATLTYDPLVRFDENLKIEPRLAESWEMIDPTTIRFHLKEGVKFHSGNTMTADDVIFSFNRISHSNDFKGLYEFYKGMNKVDDYTVDLIMKKPYPLALSNMTYLFVMDEQFFAGKNAATGKDKDAINKINASYASLNESGTGPFQLVSREKGIKTVLSEFPDYWGDRGNVDNITIMTIRESATRTSALISGDIDWIYPVPFVDVRRLKKVRGLTLYPVSGDGIIAFELNQDVVPQFKDKRVREAVNMAVNTKGIVDRLLKGNGTPASQLYPEKYAGHNESLPLRYDLKKAKALMKEAGYEKGFTVDLITSERSDYVAVSQAVSAMLSKINIKVNLNIIPSASYYQQFSNCAAGMQIIGWSSDTGDSANYSEYLTMSKDNEAGNGQYNCTGYASDKFDGIINQANQELDPSKRTALLEEAAKMTYDAAIYLPIYWDHLNFAYKNTFENFPEIINLKMFPAWGDLQVEEN